MELPPPLIAVAGSSAVIQHAPTVHAAVHDAFAAAATAQGLSAAQLAAGLAPLLPGRAAAASAADLVRAVELAHYLQADNAALAAEVARRLDGPDAVVEEVGRRLRGANAAAAEHVLLGVAEAAAAAPPGSRGAVQLVLLLRDVASPSRRATAARLRVAKALLTGADLRLPAADAAGVMEDVLRSVAATPPPPPPLDEQGAAQLADVKTLLSWSVGTLTRLGHVAPAAAVVAAALRCAAALGTRPALGLLTALVNAPSALRAAVGREPRAWAAVVDAALRDACADAPAHTCAATSLCAVAAACDAALDALVRAVAPAPHEPGVVVTLACVASRLGAAFFTDAARYAALRDALTAAVAGAAGAAGAGALGRLRVLWAYELAAAAPEPFDALHEAVLRLLARACEAGAAARPAPSFALLPELLPQHAVVTERFGVVRGKTRRPRCPAAVDAAAAAAVAAFGAADVVDAQALEALQALDVATRDYAPLLHRAAAAALARHAAALRDRHVASAVALLLARVGGEWRTLWPPPHDLGARLVARLEDELMRPVRGGPPLGVSLWTCMAKGEPAVVRVDWVAPGDWAAPADVRAVLLARLAAALNRRRGVLRCVPSLRLPAGRVVRVRYDVFGSNVAAAAAAAQYPLLDAR
jgi:hypothetical protein